ncbi:MAG: ATP-binding protein [Bacteroidales bacterium]|nr:ATP-binding protein [Bacteroidales bacterium]
MPIINGKSLLECNIEDFELLIDNPDYRENDAIDYKRVFTINYIPKEKAAEKQSEIEEFRNDVCAFANSSGGYLIFGIDEDGEGIPHELCGTNITEDNPDKFELDIKNYLQVIQPKMPHYKLKILRLENGKFLVIMFIQHDMFAPYLHISNEKNFLIYKRTGNSKTTVSYSELKAMFTNSFNIEKQIKDFRNERLEYYLSQQDNTSSDSAKFLLLHIIPETFMDSNYDKPMFVLENEGESLKNIFAHSVHDAFSRPIVEGIKYSSFFCSNEGRIYNNGTVEVFCLLDDYILAWPEGGNHFESKSIFEIITETYYAYLDIIRRIVSTQHYYACISIVGCKDITSEGNSVRMFASKIDRNKLICEPILIDSTTDDLKERCLKELKIQFYLSLGVKNNSELTKAIEEVYKR